jgi:hypothetical protein
MQDQQMVHALLSHTPHEALADRIGSGSVIGRLEKLDATGRGHPVETGSKLAVVITYQILGRLSIGRGFSELLRHPGIGRGSGDAGMDHPSCLELNDEEGKELSKEEICDLEEVTRPDLCGVGVQKVAHVCPFGWWVRTVLRYFWMVRLHTCMPSFRSSPRILSAPQSRFSFAISRIKAMVSAATFGWCEEAFDLRFQYKRKSSRCHREPRVWLNNEEGLFPGPNHPCQEDEEHPICFRACWPFHLPFENDELLS